MDDSITLGEIWKHLRRLTLAQVTTIVTTLGLCGSSLVGFGYRCAPDHAQELSKVKKEATYYRLAYQMVVDYVAAHFDTDREAQLFISKFSLSIPALMNGGWGAIKAGSPRDRRYRQSRAQFMQFIQQVRQEPNAPPLMLPAIVAPSVGSTSETTRTTPPASPGPPP